MLLLGSLGWWPQIPTRHPRLTTKCAFCFPGPKHPTQCAGGLRVNYIKLCEMSLRQYLSSNLIPLNLELEYYKELSFGNCQSRWIFKIRTSQGTTYARTVDGITEIHKKNNSKKYGPCREPHMRGILEDYSCVRLVAGNDICEVGFLPITRSLYRPHAVLSGKYFSQGTA